MGGASGEEKEAASMGERKLRVIQWATGSVGRHAIPAIVGSENLELAGVWVFTESKAGRDAGELAGIAPLGIKATRDADALLALDADCVLYAPLLADLDEMCRILEAGKNLVTPTGWVFLKDAALCDRIQAACKAGGVSFHGTGIHPGFGGDRLPLVISALSRRIDKVRVYELCDLSNMSESPEMVFGQLGFGATPEQARSAPPALLGVMSRIFCESMDMVAAGLGFELDEYRTGYEFALATRDLELKVGRIPRGRVAGQHYHYTGLVRGEPMIEFRTYWKMSEHIEPRWPYEATLEYRVELDGDPPLRCSFGPVTSGTSSEFGLLATAMNCVNAIAPVCAAPPGIRTPLDLPLITARGRVRLPGRR